MSNVLDLKKKQRKEKGIIWSTASLLFSFPDHLCLLREDYSHYKTETWTAAEVLYAHRAPCLCQESYLLPGHSFQWQTIPLSLSPMLHHVLSCPLWGWTSWMENKWALSAAQSTSYDVCRFFNLTMPVKPKQDPEQCTQLTSQEMTGFSSVSHMPRFTVTDISYTLFDRHKLISLWNCKMRPDWQPKWWNWPETMTPAQVPESVVPQMCQCLSKLQKNLYDCKYFDKFMAV